MAVTGQFGKIITGSGSVASAISGIASSYITLRLNRVYNAFINKESFEGREVTAAVAIELLNKMMAITTKGGKSQMDVEETLRAVRKANRTRTLNEVDGKLKELGAVGDFANKVRVIEEMLLDPTLNPDETADLREELNDAVDDLLVNTQNQFAAGGKVTLNGKTVDFASGANEDVLLGLFDDQIEKNPETSEKLNKQRVTAQASILVAKANAAWLSKSRTTDSLKAEGYAAQLKFLQEAYDLLDRSKYGLATEAQALLTQIRTVQDNQATAKKNIAGTAAGQAITAGYDNIFSDLDLLDSALKKDPTVAALFGNKETFAGYLISDQNYALSVLDKYIANNGGFISRPDGTKIQLTIENLSDIMKDARVAANGLTKWAKNNPNVSADDKATINSWDTFATGLGKSAPILTVEDRYDDAVDTLSKGMTAAGADIGARAAALRKFGDQLKRLSTTAGLPPSIQKSLLAEGDVYLTGKPPAEGVTLYGDYSGNLSSENGISGIYNINEILGGVINPEVGAENLSIFNGITAIYGQEDDWIASGGTIITDIDGNDVADTGSQDTSAWEKGQGVILKTVGTMTINGTATINTLVDQNLQRLRIAAPGIQVNPDDPNASTLGWVARVKQADGTFKYIVTMSVINQATGKPTGTERLLSGTAAAEWVRVNLRNGNWDSMIQTIGGNKVITVPPTSFDGVELVGDEIKPNTLVDGSLWGMITNSTSGYGWANEYQNLVDESIRKAIKVGQLVIRNGKVYIPNGKKIGGSQGESTVDLDISSMLSPDMLAKVLALFPSVDTDTGEGGDAGAGEDKPVGKERWTGTQWAGQEGSTVISTTASGKPLTLDEAFSSGTGYMYDTKPKGTGGAGPNGIPTGRGISPAAKAKLDAEMGKYDRARAQAVRGAGMNNVVTGGISRAQQADEGGRMLQTFMRNMPTGKGGIGVTPSTATKPTYKPIARNRVF